MDIRFEHTTKLGRNGHRHLVYFQQDGTPVIAEAKDHYHEVEPQVEVDPVSQQPMVVGYTILEENGHTHEFSGVFDMPASKDKRGSDDEEVATLKKLFESAKEYEGPSRKKAQESMDFYLGEQWKSEDENSLKAKNRVVLTINQIAPAIDTLSGYFRQNRTDFKLWPVEGSDAVTADVFTEILRNVAEQNGIETEETQVFEDQTIAGRGLFHSYVSYDDNIRGDIKIERYEWDEVWFGPHNKCDGSDAEHMHKGKWFSMEKLKQLYPQKAEDIQTDFMLTQDSCEPHQRFQGRQYEVALDDVDRQYDPDFIDIRAKEYFVVESEQKEYTNIPILLSVANEITYNADGWSDEDIAAAKSIGFNVIERPSHKMRVTKFAGNVLLDDEVVEEKNFTITPVYARKRKEVWFGKVENAKDPQRELNKTRSHCVDIMNRSVANGWFYGSQTFMNKVDEENFTRQATSPGAKIKVADVTKPPIPMRTDPVPSALIQSQETARNEVREILNVRPEVLDSKSTSGLALVEGKKSVLVGNEFLYDNMAQSKKRLGKRLIKLIQDVYTPERVMRVLGTMSQRRPVQVNGQNFDSKNEQQYNAIYQTIKTALENDELMKLDLVVGESSHSPNKQMADFTMLLEIGRVTGGQAIPPTALVETSPLAEDQKQKILQGIQQQQQAAAKAEEEKRRMEIEKSMPDEIKMQQARQQQMQQMQQMRQGPQQGNMPPIQRR